MSKPFTSNKNFPALAAVALLAVVALASAALICGNVISGSLISGSPAPSGLTPAASAAPAIAPATRTRITESFAALPLGFEANQGQVDPQVKYLARGHGYTLFLTATDAVISLSSPVTTDQATSARLNSRTSPSRSANTKKFSTSTVRMSLLNANSQPRVAASERLPGKINYIIGNDPDQWHTNVGQYARVVYDNVYPGVNMAFHGAQRQMEFDFIVAPGADTAPIKLGFSGTRNIATDASGNLLLSSSGGDLTLHRPVAYQQQNGARQPVDARFLIKAGNQVALALGPYDRSRELVIDPSVSYATYLGGTLEDDGNAIAIDSTGNAYVTGQTMSTNFPTVTGGHSTSNAGLFDVFVTKISPDGSTLVYSTYIGGTGADSGNAIAVDASGNAFVAGGTGSSNFPTVGGGFQTVFGGGNLDAFVLELSSTGGLLLASTFLGGTGDDFADGIAIDSTGVYVVGSTASTNFPVLNPLPFAGLMGGFVTELNPTLTARVYSTYLGAGSSDLAVAVAVDSSHNTYVTGATKVPTFPTTAGAFQTTCGSDGNCNGGLYDAFVSVIQPGGGNFVYSTFLGGEASDEGFGIAVDAAGDAYVTGLTASSAHFPLKSAYQGTYGGGAEDAFVAALNPTGTALLYSTYLGGELNDTATSIAIDAARNVYVTGQTGSTKFPTVNPTQAALKGGNDAFVTEFNSTGTAVFSTYLGGSLNENSVSAGGNVGALGAIAASSSGASFYVTGNTASTDFPTVSPEQSANAGGTDAFVAKFTQPTTPDFVISATALSPASVSPGGSATSTVTVNGLNGFTNSVALTCSVAPAGPTCGVSPATVAAGATSTLTVSTTTSTSNGNYTITVTGTFGPAHLVHTTTVSLAVTGPDFTIAATALSPASVADGSSATSTVTVTAVNGYTGTVNLTCSATGAGTPAPKCTLSTSSITGSGTATVTAHAIGASGALLHPSSIFYAAWLPLLGLSLIGTSFSTRQSRSKKLSILFLGLVIGALLFLPACGGSSNNPPPPPPPPCAGCTPAGNYTVTVTGTDSANANLTHSVAPPLTLTVQ